MEHIVKTYGRFFLAFVTALLLWAFVYSGIKDDDGNVGIFHMMGAAVSGYLADSRPGSDFAVYEEESKKDFPTVFYIASGNLVTGTEISLTDLFQAQDGEGQAVTFYVLSVAEEYGAEDAVELSEDGTTVTFFDSGIYVFEIKTQDEQNRETVKKIRVPVNAAG